MRCKLRYEHMKLSDTEFISITEFISTFTGVILIISFVLGFLWSLAYASQTSSGEIVGSNLLALTFFYPFGSIILSLLCVVTFAHSVFVQIRLRKTSPKFFLNLLIICFIALPYLLFMLIILWLPLYHLLV